MRSKILFILLIIIAIGFIAGMLFVIVYAAQRVEENINSDSPVIPTTVSAVETTEETQAIVYPYSDTGNMNYEDNKDMVGWISIDDTVIDYPIMQTPSAPDYYLTRDFNKESSLYGCPYVQSNCDIHKPSDNIIVYSHYMKDGSMFAGLENYKDAEFCKKHKTIYVELDGKVRHYEIMSVIALPFTTDDRETFKFYDFVEARDPKSFNEFAKKSKSLSLYETGVTAKYGDKLLTLATSEYNENNERLVIIAKQI